MQKLFFEPAWDKTIAEVDRELITKHFRTLQPKDNVYLSFLREAVNHKNELLVTVLIHNGQRDPLQIEETAIAYQPAHKSTIVSVFHLPLLIPAKTSMPWTFIFSSSNQTEQIPVYIIRHDRHVSIY